MIAENRRRTRSELFTFIRFIAIDEYRSAPDLEEARDASDVDLPADRHVREGSYVFDKAHGFMQVVDGEPVVVKARNGRSAEGIPEKHVRIIRKPIPVRDPVREVLKA